MEPPTRTPLSPIALFFSLKRTSVLPKRIYAPIRKGRSLPTSDLPFQLEISPDDLKLPPLPGLQNTKIGILLSAPQTLVFCNQSTTISRRSLLCWTRLLGTFCDSPTRCAPSRRRDARQAGARAGQWASRRRRARARGRWAKAPRRRFVHGCAADPLRHRPSVSGQEKPHTTRPSDPPNSQEPPSEAPQSHRVNPLKSQAERPAGHHPTPLTTHRGK